MAPSYERTKTTKGKIAAVPSYGLGRKPEADVGSIPSWAPQEQSQPSSRYRQRPNAFSRVRSPMAANKAKIADEVQ
jgi:hypothetical protein